MQVTISATSIGGNAGPFDIYQNFDTYTTPVATGVSRASILAGYVVTINDATTTVRLTSSGTCTNSTDISVVSPSPTPTPTATPSATPVANILYWQYSRADPAVGAVFTITQNSSTVVNTTAVSDSGQFSYSPGDSIVITSAANVKTTDYTGVCVYTVDNSTLLYSDNETNIDAIVSFTAASGGYDVSGLQGNAPTNCPIP